MQIYIVALCALQMWRERLGRQQAQAEAVQLRMKDLEQWGSLSCVTLDEAVMTSLQRVRAYDMFGA